VGFLPFRPEDGRRLGPSVEQSEEDPADGGLGDQNEQRAEQKTFHVSG
jgi:hypothetical protein